MKLPLKIFSLSSKVKSEVEKLPRQQRKDSMKVKMDEFAQSKQVMVRPEKIAPSQSGEYMGESVAT